jgi:hypothetical protein
MLMKTCIALFVALMAASAAAAQNADDYRGGWRTDSGESHTFQFSIRGERVRGVACTRCADATTLAFVDGTFGASGITFVVTHVDDTGRTTYQDRATAKLEGGKLVVAGRSGAPKGGAFTYTLIKDARGPDPLPMPVSVLPADRGPVMPVGRGGFGGGAPGGAPPAAGGGAVAGPGAPGPGGARAGAPAGAGDAAAPVGRAGGAPGAGRAAAPGGGGRGGYVPPSSWKKLTHDDVVGVWIGFGTGPNKQYFIIRKVGNGLRGMVCGRCDNPYTMAALDDFVIDGATMTFNILHEDWGPGTLPFHNEATVRVAMNEMRLSTQQDNMPRPAQPPGPNAGSSLIGPISFAATKGNTYD